METAQRQQLRYLRELQEALRQPELWPEAEVAARFRRGILTVESGENGEELYQVFKAEPSIRDSILEEVEAKIGQLQQELLFEIEHQNPARFVALIQLQHLLLNYESYAINESAYEIVERLANRELTTLGSADPAGLAEKLLTQPGYRAEVLHQIQSSLETWRRLQDPRLRQLLPAVTPAVVARLKAQLRRGLPPDPEIQILLLLPDRLIEVAQLLGFGFHNQLPSYANLLRQFNRLDYTPACLEYNLSHVCYIKAAARGDLLMLGRLEADPDLLDVDRAEAAKMAMAHPALFERLYTDDRVQAVVTAAQQGELNLPGSRQGDYDQPEDFGLGAFLGYAAFLGQFDIFEQIYADPRLICGDVGRALSEIGGDTPPEFVEILYDTGVGRFRLADFLDWLELYPEFQPPLAAVLPALQSQPSELTVAGAAAAAEVDLADIDRYRPLIQSADLTAAFIRVAYSYRKYPISQLVVLLKQLLGYQDAYRQIYPATLEDAREIWARDAPELLPLIGDSGT